MLKTYYESGVAIAMVSKRAAAMRELNIGGVNIQNDEDRFALALVIHQIPDRAGNRLAY